MDIKWERTSRGNEVLEGEGFYISYNANPCSEFSLLRNEKNSDETALYAYANNIWYILNGDFRKDYEKRVKKGLKACLDFYESKKKEYRCNWSTDER